MTTTYSITPDKITHVKQLLTQCGIRESARVAGVSYYTAWCISQGKYDNDQPLQQVTLINRCPITGYKL